MHTPLPRHAIHSRPLGELEFAFIHGLTLANYPVLPNIHTYAYLDKKSNLRKSHLSYAQPLMPPWVMILVARKGIVKTEGYVGMGTR